MVNSLPLLINVKLNSFLNYPLSLIKLELTQLILKFFHKLPNSTYV